MDYRLLILGGTSEARSLAAELAGRGVTVVSSLAGRVAEPRLPAGKVRTGGFGGPDGLARWIGEHGITAVVDATHPFAERISASAVAGARKAEVPLLRLERPGWTPPEGLAWHWADSVSDAASKLPGLADRVFVTTGRQGIAAFAGLDQTWFLIRCVEQPEPPLPRQHELLLSRGPYTTDGELALMRAYRIEALVTKDSGGAMTSAKLEAARILGIPVVAVRRPAGPDAETVHTVDEAVKWVTTQQGSRCHT